jgi:ferric enterobactin receptor
VIKSIAAEHPVQFDYEASSLEKFIITRRPFMEPLDKFLDKVLPPHGLHWMSTPDGTIAIFTEEDYARRKATGGINTRSYQGPATKTNLSLSGRVFDKTTGETLPFVSILVHGTTIGTTSNVDGYFSLLKVPSDTSTLIFSYIGYTTEKVFLSPDLNLEHLEVNLETTGTILDAVVVTSERQDLMRAGDQVSKLRMTPDKLAALPNIGERDVFRSFQLMPGISAANEHTSGLYVRGGTPDQALTLFDGFTVYNVDHLFGFFSAFNANAIKDVQLYKGAFDAKYGGRLSSVVEITGKTATVRPSILVETSVFSVPMALLRRRLETTFPLL